MRRQTLDIILLCSSIASFFIMSFTFSVMPLLEKVNIEPRTRSIINGTIIWACLLLGIALQIVLAKRRKNWLKSNSVRRSHLSHRKIGVIAFAQNIYGCVADIIFVLSLVTLILSMIITKSVGYICYISFSTIIFSFCLHCILNGKIFFFVQNQNKSLSETKDNN